MTTPSAGDRKRDEALDLFEGNNDRRAVIRRAREALAALWRERDSIRMWHMAPSPGQPAGPYVNGDDATDLLDGLSYGDDRRIIGAIFRPGSGWEYLGMVKSRHTRRHGRRIACWRWAPQAGGG